MIVPAMNSEEIINEILLDLPKVLHKKDSFLCNLRRAAIKSETKMIYKCWDYKSPRKNDWVIELKSTPSICSAIYAVHYLNKQGVNFIAVKIDASYHHYSGHFLDRYNERFLNQMCLSRLDIFKSFIHHNIISIPEKLYPIDTEIERVMIKLNDGIAFGTQEEINGYKIFNYKTFISNDMVLSFQKKDVNDARSHYEEFLNEHPVAKKFQAM